jgi:hypothetical protein
MQNDRSLSKSIFLTMAGETTRQASIALFGCKTDQGKRLEALQPWRLLPPALIYLVVGVVEGGRAAVAELIRVRRIGQP